MKQKTIFLITFSLVIFLMGLNQSYAQQNISSFFIELKSKFVEEDNFSITFPSIPRKKTITQVTEDNKLTITSYQADDGVGLYTFSVGKIEQPLKEKGIKKYFIENLFNSLVSTAPNVKIYTKEQSNRDPYDLSYFYTSTYQGVDWAHMGDDFFSK